MARYNNFIGHIECPYCHHLIEATFQSDIGILDYVEFFLGDSIFGRKPIMAKPEIRPEPGLENTDFWSYGIARCPNCHKTIWAKIIVRKNQFDGITLIDYEPPSPYDWGLLNDNDADSFSGDTLVETDKG